jgi:hypothetical protein
MSEIKFGANPVYKQDISVKKVARRGDIYLQNAVDFQRTAMRYIPEERRIV